MSTVVESGTLLDQRVREGKAIRVLDKGYVAYVEHMGSDLTIANSARASFAKESTELSDRDTRLIKFLAREGHYSPFRHCFVSIEVKAPLMVARQWWKYVTGSDHMDSFSTSWNESSRRYITMDPEFHIPAADEWRSAPDNKKQGSGSPIGPWTGATLSQELMEYVEKGEQLYSRALNDGVAPEQARLFLPAYGMYVVWRWSSSLQAIAHFLNQRLPDDAQFEIQEYANAVYRLVQPLFPIAIRELVQ